MKGDENGKKIRILKREAVSASSIYSRFDLLDDEFLQSDIK